MCAPGASRGRASPLGRSGKRPAKSRRRSGTGSRRNAMRTATMPRMRRHRCRQPRSTRPDRRAPKADPRQGLPRSILFKPILKTTLSSKASRIKRGWRAGLTRLRQNKRRSRKERLRCQAEVSRDDPQTCSERIVHLEFDRMRGHLEALDFRHLQFDIAIDEVVVEHAAVLEEGAVLVEIFQRLA